MAKQSKEYNYKLGIGDTLALTLIKSKIKPTIRPSDENQNVIIRNSTN